MLLILTSEIKLSKKSRKIDGHFSKCSTKVYIVFFKNRDCINFLSGKSRQQSDNQYKHQELLEHAHNRRETHRGQSIRLRVQGQQKA